MRTELENIYEQLFNSYDQGYYSENFTFKVDFYTQITGRIKKEIERLETEFKADWFHEQIKIRADAKLFLLLVFHQVIAVPIASESAGSNRELLTGHIESDVAAILRSAYAEKKSALVKEITAHTILSTVDRLWSNLKISDALFWND